MKKWLFVLFFGMVSSGMSYPNRIISQPLLELLEVTGVSHDGSYAAIMRETQKKWLRPAGKERWQIPDVDPEKREQIVELADQLGFIHPLRPQKKAYDYCLILGGTVGSMQTRLNYLIKLSEQGIRFKTIVFLTGQRPLDSAIEPVSAKNQNESQAAHNLWEETALPHALRNCNQVFVDVPMFITESGTRRPTTKDTYIEWLALHPKPGSALIISNQPFCLYQHALAQSCLTDGFEVETVGEGAQKENQLGVVLLDSIAQWIYYSSFLPKI